MLFLLSLVARALAGVLAGRRADGGSKDLEIIVLRHQLRVLRRKAGRPRLRAWDRVRARRFAPDGTASLDGAKLLFLRGFMG